MRNGFRILEFLIIISVLGFLTVILLPKYQDAQMRSRTAKAILQVRNLYDAQQRFFKKNGKYSDYFAALDISLPSPAATNCRGPKSVECKKAEGFDYEFYTPTNEPPISAEATNGEIIIVSYWEPVRQGKFGKMTCIARSDQGREHCLDLGGVLSKDLPNYYIIGF